MSMTPVQTKPTNKQIKIKSQNYDQTKYRICLFDQVTSLTDLLNRFNESKL